MCDKFTIKNSSRNKSNICYMEKPIYTSNTEQKVIKYET